MVVGDGKDDCSCYCVFIIAVERKLPSGDFYIMLLIEKMLLMVQDEKSVLLILF